MRGLFTGVANIVRFNWHFYVVAIIAAMIGIAVIPILPSVLQAFAIVIWLAGVLATLTSLIVSWYVYDLSGIYNFGWVPKVAGLKPKNILNIHAGFDETSELIKQHFSDSQVKILDFYDPTKHTEISIRRARNVYPASEDTLTVQTSELPIAKDSIDLTFVIFAAHEIRNENERAAFFRELSRVSKKGVPICVVEHLRDWRNFFAYSIGFLHFHSKKTWLDTFHAAELHVEKSHYINPFVTLFTLHKK